MPKYYPVMLNIEAMPALVVGGGPIAVRKAAALADYGARVTIVARKACEEARRMAAEGRAVLRERPFELADLEDPLIVFAATDDRRLHEQIKVECDRRRILCNIVDVPDLCGFIVPSIIRRGELMITISTDGTCPAYSKFQRKRMELCCFGEGAEKMLHVIAAAREELKKGTGEGFSDEEKFEMLRSLAESDLAEILESRGEEEAARQAVDRVREEAGRRKAHRATG